MPKDPVDPGHPDPLGEAEVETKVQLECTECGGELDDQGECNDRTCVACPDFVEDDEDDDEDEDDEDEE